MSRISNQQSEVNHNYEAFMKQLPELMPTHGGKFAPDARRQNCRVLFDTARDAFVAGQALFKPDHCFSIQEVIQGPIDLGFYSHAML
ncbi:MAG: hypothetical protein OXN90_19460 [Gemmatimonadota bacterium]|nr:hypothetical protein [Gemmatimonadota bacterium]